MLLPVSTPFAWDVPRSAQAVVRVLSWGLASLLHVAVLTHTLYYLLVFSLVPGVALYEHVVPAVLRFLEALEPVADIFFQDVLRALGIVLASLLLPGSLFFFLKLVLLPLSYHLARLLF
ncbi:hypothetical protein Y1Q_0017158 [Alligator mississippiensis]|uniref:Uncharacterized protein n=1 Tax=Alligator mississippiensis TaxID=8496 RepID=A0A151NZE5_ALLMI|nr:hypothetical protein Y1Q_0017158 [Alligator mississippiensis]